MTITWIGAVRVGRSCLVVLTGATPGAGVVWRLAQGGGVLTPISTHADKGGAASATYTVNDAVDAVVRVEADVYA